MRDRKGNEVPVFVAFQTSNTSLVPNISRDQESGGSHSYFLNDSKLMCILDNAFKSQNGKWLRKGKHRWGVVKAHRRESRKGKIKYYCIFKNPYCIF